MKNDSQQIKKNLNGQSLSHEDILLIRGIRNDFDEPKRYRPEIVEQVYSYSQGSSDPLKNKKNEKDKNAVAREDWEGGASRPENETDGEEDGPPKNLQSIPTQNTHEINLEEESDLGTAKDRELEGSRKAQA